MNKLNNATLIIVNYYETLLTFYLLFDSSHVKQKLSEFLDRTVAILKAENCLCSKSHINALPCIGSQPYQVVRLK